MDTEQWVVVRATRCPGLPGTDAVYACCPGVVIDNISSTVKNVSVWMIDQMVTLVTGAS